MSSSDTSVFQNSIPNNPENCGQNDIDSINSMELSVFLMNELEICLSFEDQTRGLTANRVLDKVFEQLKHRNLKFDPKYKPLFAIWITSPHLELQLKPTHRPFNVLSKWDSLLQKHGPQELITDPILIEKDEPTLSFQRNVFCDQMIENEIDDNDIGALYLLYFEAKMNVLDGRYPSDDFQQLAAYQMAIDLETSVKVSVDFIRQNLRKYIPFNYLKASDGNKFNGLIRTLSRNTQSSRLAQKIFDKYQHISQQNLSKYKLLRSYLEKCWEIPCYGSAYFSAQIERPIKSKIDSFISHFDLEIWVAINRTGIYLISKEKPELLLSIDHVDLCWAVGRPENSDPNCIPCIYIQIPDQNNDEILQIFSRQYILIESLLNSFIKMAKLTYNSNDMNRQSYDVTDGPIQRSRTVTDGPEPPPRNVQPLHSVSSFSKQTNIRKPERLSFAKFNSSGQVINKTGSWVRVLKDKN